MSDLDKHECPASLQRAFLDLMGQTFLLVRVYASDVDMCFALADHAHNVPALLADYRPGLLRFYWEVSRPCLIGALHRHNPELSVSFFDEPWKAIEAEYYRLCGRSDA